MEQDLKAPGQNGTPQILLIAALCAVVALLGFALLRAPYAPSPAMDAASPPVPTLPADRQALVEMRLREQVESLIGAVIGRQNVRAIVSAEIEADQTRQVSETGEPGANRTETTTIHSSGRIGRLTVSIMVNGRQETGPNGTIYRPRTEAELARFSRLARDAVGFDAMRGDSLTVETVRFAPAEETPSGPNALAHILSPSAGIALAAGFGLAALFFVGRRFGWRKAGATAAQELARTSVIASPAPADEIFTSDAARSPALRRAGEAVTGRPAAAAAVLRQWMSA